MHFVLEARNPPIGEPLIEVLQFECYDPESYKICGTPSTGILNQGDAVDLGDDIYQVRHVNRHP
ncbi:MAG: hypothetical protein JJ894_17030 [Dinoroseobacter sp.]|nr:hypothetical protein [Dinoroseobacter sp.]